MDVEREGEMLMSTDTRAALEMLTVNLIEAEPSPWWHILRIQSQGELRAFRWLAYSGLRPYLPVFRTTVAQNFNKRRSVVRMMMPSYLFLPSEQVERMWDRREQAPVTINLLRLGDMIAAIPQNAIDRIRATEEWLSQGNVIRRASIEYRVGDWVQLVDIGAMTGFMGQIMKLLPEKGRISVDVASFGRQTPVEVSVNQVRLV